jgi:hypothetical protein
MKEEKNLFDRACCQRLYRIASLFIVHATSAMSHFGSICLHVLSSYLLVCLILIIAVYSIYIIFCRSLLTSVAISEWVLSKINCVCTVVVFIVRALRRVKLGILYLVHFMGNTQFVNLAWANYDSVARSQLYSRVQCFRHCLSYIRCLVK